MYVKVVLPMLIKHCNTKHKHFDCWHLHSTKDLFNRKLYLFVCGVCNKKIVLLEQFSRKKAKCYHTSYFGVDADKVLNKYKDSLFYKESDFKLPKQHNTYKWVYGINTNVYDKVTGKVIGTKSYACDFYGNKIEV